MRVLYLSEGGEKTPFPARNRFGGRRLRADSRPSGKKTPFWFGQDTHNVSPLVEDLFTELENRYTGYQLQVESLLRQILIRLVRNFEEKRDPEHPPDP